MSVPVLKQADVLIASLPAAVSDRDLMVLQDDLADCVGFHRSAGVVIDVSVLDVIDSFATRMLQGIARVAGLRGAIAVVVGIQPEVAYAMMQLGLTMDGVATALDLETGLALLAEVRSRRGA